MSDASLTLLSSHFFLTTIPRPPTSTLFPYTTLFRSGRNRSHAVGIPAVAPPGEIVRRHDYSSCIRTIRHRRDRLGCRSEEHTSELQSRGHLVCRLLLEKKNNRHTRHTTHHTY